VVVGSGDGMADAEALTFDFDGADVEIDFLAEAAVGPAACHVFKHANSLVS